MLTAPPVSETARYIERAELVFEPSRDAWKAVLWRTYREMREELDAREQVPGWLQLAKARQGIE